MHTSIFGPHPYQKSEQLAGSIRLPLRMQIERVTSDLDESGWRAASGLSSSRRKWNVENILGWYLNFFGWLILKIYWVDTWVASSRVRFWYIAASAVQCLKRRKNFILQNPTRMTLQLIWRWVALFKIGSSRNWEFFCKCNSRTIGWESIWPIKIICREGQHSMPD